MLKNSQQFIDKCSTLLDVPIENKNISAMPLAWTKTFYKEYPRFKSFPLPVHCVADSTIKKILQKRISAREFSPDGIKLSKVAELLYWSLGENKMRKSPQRRFYPSGGARYPVECYVLAKKIVSLPDGLYHFNIKNNSLETIFEKNIRKISNNILFNNFDSAAAIIILTGVLSRTEVKYGTKSLLYINNEAGHIGQNIYLMSTELNIDTCEIAGFNIGDITTLLDLDVNDEIPLFCFALGNKKGGDK